VREYLDRDVTALLTVKTNTFIANQRFDPTYVETHCVQVLKPFARPAMFEITFADCFEMTARVRVLGQEQMFISSLINPRLWRPLNWAYRKLQERKLREQYEAMGVPFDYDPFDEEQDG